MIIGCCESCREYPCDFVWKWDKEKITQTVMAKDNKSIEFETVKRVTKCSLRNPKRADAPWAIVFNNFQMELYDTWKEVEKRILSNEDDKGKDFEHLNVFIWGVSVFDERDIVCDHVANCVKPKDENATVLGDGAHFMTMKKAFDLYNDRQVCEENDCELEDDEAWVVHDDDVIGITDEEEREEFPF